MICTLLVALVLGTATAKTCSLYAISDDASSCGQSDLDCKYSSYAKDFEKKLKDGTCASQGYTVKTSTETKKVPVIGDIVITQYKKPAVDAGEPCCVAKCAKPGEEKFYSVAKSTMGKPHCGECCMDPKKYKLYHFFEKNLTKADNDSPCKAFGYTKYDSTVTHGFGPVKMTLDLYDLAKELTTPSAATLSGVYEGEFLPFVDITATFGGAGTVDMDINVKIAHQEIKCASEKITETSAEVTFTNIQTTGDCMGDALRKQKKDVTKFKLEKNADGTLTFKSSWPDMKLKPKTQEILV